MIEKECAIGAYSFSELNALADDFKLNYKIIFYRATQER